MDATEDVNGDEMAMTQKKPTWWLLYRHFHKMQIKCNIVDVISNVFVEYLSPNYDWLWQVVARDMDGLLCYFEYWGKGGICLN